VDREAFFRQVLEPGERLIWAGRPMTGTVIAALVFYLLGGGFMLLFLHRIVNNSALREAAPAQGIILAIELMLLLGVLFLLYSIYRTAQMGYAVTDRRLLMTMWLKKSSVIEAPLNRLIAAKLVSPYRSGRAIRFEFQLDPNTAGSPRNWRYVESHEAYPQNRDWTTLRNLPEICQLIENARREYGRQAKTF
jgi:hypothetical protein